MGMLVIEDLRELVFPVFSVQAEGNGIFLKSRLFLGTCFFVSRCGDAITADHVIPKPQEIPEGHRLAAIVQEGGEEKVCWITHCAKFPRCDLALLHVNLQSTKYLQMSEERIMAGTDIQVIGIPSHQVYGRGLEMRVLKGHVTLSSDLLELNFPVPLGMSGSPVLVGTKVVGYVTGTVRSGEMEEASEETEEISNGKDIITRTEIRRAIYYGLAYPFSHLSGICDPIFEDKPLYQFIADRNRSHEC